MSDAAHIVRAMALAVDAARAGNRGPFGAVIVRGGEIVAEGQNLVVAANDPTAHSEVVAIRSACEKLGTYDLSGCDVYTSCEPCPMCLGAIYWARIKRVYYVNTRQEAAAIGFDDDFIYREVPLAPEARSVPAIRVTVDDPQIAFRTWVANPNKVEY
jgi:tRNA(Arg) A34 adenosine deaminase TadA